MRREVQLATLTRRVLSGTLQNSGVFTFCSLYVNRDKKLSFVAVGMSFARDYATEV
jgi:hypothetical protein